jgi:hypothetical protein
MVKPRIDKQTLQIRVVGAYLPRLDVDALSAYVNAETVEFKSTLRSLRDRGFSVGRDAAIDARALELRDEMTADLECCALFEVEVKNNSAEFDPSEFHNPDNGLHGWEPVFLTLSGRAVAFEGSTAPAELSEFRVAFYIQQWTASGRLVGATGQLLLPRFKRVPQRLWRLAPYSCVD